MVRCVLSCHRLTGEINGNKNWGILCNIGFMVLLVVTSTSYLSGCGVFSDIFDRNLDIVQRSNSIHSSRAEDPTGEQMPTTYILDFGKQRFIKNIAIYCHQPVKDIAIYTCLSNQDRVASPLNLGWTFLKYIESPLKSGDIIEIQLVASSIQLIQEIREGDSQPKSKDGIRQIEAFGEYGNKLLQTKLSILQTLMLPNRWTLARQSGKALKTSPVKREFWEDHYLQVFQTKYPKLEDIRSIVAPLDDWPWMQRQAYLDAKVSHEKDLQQQRDLIDKRNFWAAAIVPIVWFYLTFYGLRWH